MPREHNLTEWETMPLPTRDNDDVRLVHVFSRADFSSVFPTSCTVALDCRPSRIQKRLADRLCCLLCARRAGNRKMCAHEVAANKFLAE